MINTKIKNRLISFLSIIVFLKLFFNTTEAVIFSNYYNNFISLLFFFIGWFLLLIYEIKFIRYLLTLYMFIYVTY